MSDFPYVPVWGRLIVLPDDIQDTDPVYKKAKEAGLIVEHALEKNREQFAQVEGILTAVGGNCFQNWLGETPAVGDRVMFDKYAGCSKVIDGKTYRVISDTDILAIVR